MKRASIRLQWFLASFIWLVPLGALGGSWWVLWQYNRSVAAVLTWLMTIFMLACVGGWIATLVLGCLPNAKPLCCAGGGEREIGQEIDDGERQPLIEK
jgi:hypothetical protein